jgi:L-fucose mutarotase
MLRQDLIHPEILRAVAAAGHHATILIADGNYPASTKKGPNATVVPMNLSPGIITCDQALRALLSAVPVETINTMMYETTGPYALSEDPPVWAQFRQSITDAGLSIDLEPIEKWAFYEAVGTPDHVLTVQTADQHLFANVLLTVAARTD